MDKAGRTTAVRQGKDTHPAMLELLRRRQSLLDDGYSVYYEAIAADMFYSRLIFYRRCKSVSLICYLREGRVVQRSNGRIVYDKTFG